MPHLIHQKYRPDIDGLRAVAIISVVIYHYFPKLLPGGFVGVDVFFVISGFLITRILLSSHEKNRFSLLEFYIRRIRRIFPALVLVLVATMLFGWLVLPPEEFSQLNLHTAAGAGFLQNFILWQESGYFDTASESKPLLHLWSLAVEEQFYIIWPLLTALAWKLRWRFLRIAALLAFLSFIANIYLVSGNPGAAFYLPFSRFWELIVGGVLACLFQHSRESLVLNRTVFSMAGPLLLLTGFALIDRSRSFPGWWVLLPTIGASFVILSERSWFNENVLASRPMVWIGQISYPLYLWHWPLLAFTSIAEVHASKGLRLLGIAISVCLAWLTYKFVEKPLRFGSKPRTKAALLMLIMGLIGVVGIMDIPPASTKWQSIKGVDPELRKYDFQHHYRLGKCFLHGHKDENFSDECNGGKSQPTVVLWGDSYAASLYQGLLKQSDRTGFNLAQYTTSGCPPVLGIDIDIRAGCRQINHFVFDRIAALKPDTVILAANWMLYDGKHVEGGKPFNMVNDISIEDTLRAVRDSGVRTLVVVGQLPVFTKSQVKVGLKNFVPNNIHRTFSDYDHQSSLANERLRTISKGINVQFVSPIDLLCNQGGCLISAKKEKLIPIAWDVGHLTTVGSELVIEKAIAAGVLKLPERMARQPH